MDVKACEKILQNLGFGNCVATQKGYLSGKYKSDRFTLRKGGKSKSNMVCMNIILGVFWHSLLNLVTYLSWFGELLWVSISAFLL